MKKFALIALLALSACANDAPPPLPIPPQTEDTNPRDIDECPRRDGRPCF